MKLEIFDVGHGACAMVTTGEFRFMIDCASSTEFDFLPGDMLSARGVKFLDLLAITNYDEDHARGLPNLLKNVTVGRLLVNAGVNPDVIDDLKGYEPGLGIEAAIAMAKQYNNYDVPPLDFPNVSWTVYRHSYPAFTDENNLSLVIVLKVGGVNFIFPGDMECEGWEKLIDANPSLKKELASIHVFIASHHGRDSGLCDRIFDECHCSPKLVVISDKAYGYDTQLTVPYYRAKVSEGWHFRGENRHVLTTRNDGSITFDIHPNGTGGWAMGVS